jgi:DNA relaxase NicK
MKKYGIQKNGELGYYNKGLMDKVIIQDEKFPEQIPFVQPVFGLLTDQSHEPQISKIDWLRATVRGQSTMFMVDDIIDILTTDQIHDGLDSDLSVRSALGGLHGYKSIRKVFFWANNELVNAGAIAYTDDPLDSNCGVMIDFSGSLCTYLQNNHPQKWRDLINYLAGYGWRLSRVDLALDLDGTYCRKHSLTVPVFMVMGMEQNWFSSSFSRNQQAMTTKQVGDWSWNAAGTKNAVNYQDYQPDKLAPNGLTAYFGSRKSPNFFRVYEKGKQLLGLADDADAAIDKWWVRIEQEIKRDKDGAALPYELLLEPDAWFGASRPNLRELLNDYRGYLLQNTIIAATRKRHQAKERSLSVKSKIFWARRAYGRLIHTLVSEGFESEEIVNELLRDKGLKNYVYDIIQEIDAPICDAFITPRYPASSPSSVELRKAYGLLQDA